MDRENRFLSALTLLCLSLLILASCAPKDMKAGEEPKPHALYPNEQRMDKSAKELEPAAKEADAKADSGF